MTDDKWQRRGRLFQLRLLRAHKTIEYYYLRARAKHAELRYRYLAWKIGKLETMDELAESKAFQYGWDNE